MDEPSKHGGPDAPKPVAIEKMEGDIIMVSTVPSPPEIPAGKGRNCPQCTRIAWRLTRHCWHCGYDFEPCKVNWGRRAQVVALLAATASVINGIIYFAVTLR